jgi:cytoskeleton protein RodZ
MPEIGSTLREARMRARIDITEVEQATKIRAKYLRALENEEWNLLPGSTFIKSFLREYAAYLGLDARSLVDEYKLRYERPSEHELMPISPNLGRERRGTGMGGPGSPPRWAVVLGLVAVLLVALYAIGSGDDEPQEAAGGRSVPRTTTTSETPPARTTGSQAPAPARTSVRILATGTLYVCLVDDRGRVLIPGATFEAGEAAPVKRARAMRLTLGNNQVELRVNGRAIRVPASAEAIAYRLTPAGVQPLSVDEAPTCTA